MGGTGQGSNIGWMGENMRDESYFLGLNRKCVSINMYLGLADHTLALGDHETQYRSHIPWWMRLRRRCQRSPPTGTNHSGTTPLNTQANTTNGAMDSAGLLWCSLNRLPLTCSWHLSTGWSFCCCKFMHEEGCSDIFCIWKLGGEKHKENSDQVSLLSWKLFIFSSLIFVSFTATLPSLSFRGLSKISSLLRATSSNKGNGEWAPDFVLTVFLFFFFFLKIFHLCWPTLLFFLQSTFLPGPLAASEAAMGTTGQPGESLRSLTRPDCWLRHTTERFRYAIWQRVTATSCLIYTVQHYRCHDYNVDSHPFEQFRHSRLWLHPLNVT